jgi:YfiH family protein
MIRKKQGEIEWLEFELLAEIPNLTHGVLLRHGGVSEGPYHSLNLGGGSGDCPERVAENRRRIFEAFNVEKWIGGKQVHGNDVAWVEHPHQDVGECDALITQRPDIGLMIKHADCQAAILYDPEHHAVANVHSGWRGNVKNIYMATVEKMKNAFGTKPENLLVGITPSLGPECAEFIHYKVELPEEFWAFQLRPDYFDLWAIARSQLEGAGVLPHHIEVAGICTYSNEHDFFSCRRQKKIHGRNGTIVILK